VANVIEIIDLVITFLSQEYLMADTQLKSFNFFLQSMYFEKTSPSPSFGLHSGSSNVNSRLCLLWIQRMVTSRGSICLQLNSFGVSSGSRFFGSKGPRLETICEKFQ
jgi:hypothetical protein